MLIGDEWGNRFQPSARLPGEGKVLIGAHGARAARDVAARAWRDRRVVGVREENKAGW